MGAMDHPERAKTSSRGQRSVLPTTYFGWVFFALVVKKNNDFNHKRRVGDGMSDPHAS